MRNLSDVDKTHICEVATMLSMTEKVYIKIRNKYPDAMDGDNAFDFVHDVLIAEAFAIREKEPYATKTIDRLEKAAYEVFSMAGELAGENFAE